jgi:ATP phosphoribosyltransferase
MSKLNQNDPLRLSIPSKGRLSDDSIALMRSCGMDIEKPNPRQYQATIRGLEELIVLFQRPGDIVSSVRDGSVDFGIAGLDLVEERRGNENEILVLHDDLKFGRCSLALAVPENWGLPVDLARLRSKADEHGRPLRVATKFPNLTKQFLDMQRVDNVMVYAEGTLETAPTIGYADIISDLVSSGQTLRDNRLQTVSDGQILKSQAVLIANKASLRANPKAMHIARFLLEYFEAYLQGDNNLAIFANMRGSSPETIADLIFNQTSIAGLQGPTISRVYVREQDSNWFAVHIIVEKRELYKTISELRAIGGSGVVVLPISYIFDEEPPRYTAMIRALEV